MNSDAFDMFEPLLKALYNLFILNRRLNSMCVGTSLKQPVRPYICFGTQAIIGTTVLLENQNKHKLCLVCM